MRHTLRTGWELLPIAVAIAILILGKQRELRHGCRLINNSINACDLPGAPEAIIIKLLIIVALLALATRSAHNVDIDADFVVARTASAIQGE